MELLLHINIPQRTRKNPFYCRILPDSETYAETNVSSSDEEKSGKKSEIVCRFCQSPITRHEDIMEISGSHLHSFYNPSGIKYMIRCFIRAHGCIFIGEPTRDFTWFPGFAWRIALCAVCFSHLGWHYLSEGSSFFGLIADNLLEIE